MDSRVVITGMGVISPAGVGVQPLLSVLQRGTSCVRRIDTFDTADLPCKIGAQVADFEAEDYLSARQAKRLSRQAQLFVAAAVQALGDAAFSEVRLAARSRVGVFEGTSLGGLCRALEENEVYLSRGYHHIHPLAVNAAMTGVGGSMVSVLHGFTGPVLAFCNGSVSSACAIAAAVDQLRLNHIDVALCGGGEAPVDRHIFLLFSRAGMLSTRNESPQTACRPFDATRDGVVLGEGAAVLVLERLEHAERRGATIYAEIAAVALTSDARSLTAPAEDGAQQARALCEAMRAARVTPSEVDYISAHGTSTRLNDRVETLAIKKAFGKWALTVPVSAMKSMVGHSLGACTSIELVGTVLAMQQGFLPPTINLTTPDPQCDLDYVPNQSRRARIDIALVNNSSFGGKNSAVLVRRYRS
jgi:3-oxoacyl-[acyl-carrier-protein] synthase II